MNATDTDTTPALTAELLSDGWSVTDGTMRWWPSDDAADKIEAATDPAAEAVRICEQAPMRGQWR